MHRRLLPRKGKRRCHAAISISKGIAGIMGWLLHASRAPGTTGMRQILFTEEIYFAVSEIRPLSVLVRSL
jgi:hypothetical protein